MSFAAAIVATVQRLACADSGSFRLRVISALPVALVSAGLAVIEQFGDLAESAAKRLSLIHI